MSNFLAIATATMALRQLIQDAAATAVPGANVTTVRPSATGEGLPEKGVNLYLYQTTPNPALRNADLPTRRTDGSLVQRPQIALDLHYLLSFYGNDGDLEPQRLLGGVASALNAHPTLTRDAIQTMITALLAADPSHYLATSDLADQVELVRTTPLPLSLDDLSKLWNALFQAPYALSTVYQASVVLIESQLAPETALPVQRRNAYAITFRGPVIQQVTAAAGVDQPIVAGGTLRITGRQLAADLLQVRLDEAAVTPTGATDTQITVPLTEPPFPAGTLRAGVHGVQVVQLVMMGTPPEARPTAASNVAPVVLWPTITGVAVANVSGTGDAPRSADLTLDISPTVGRQQRVFVLLNEQTATAPQAYTFAVGPRSADSGTLTATVQGVKAGSYFLRVQVDGAESPLDLDPTSLTFGPGVTIP